MACPVPGSRWAGAFKELRNQGSCPTVADRPAKQDRSGSLGQPGSWADRMGRLLRPAAGRPDSRRCPHRRDRCRRHERAAELIGDVQLIGLTPELLRKVTAQLAGRYAPETVARTMRWVRLTLNQAVRDRRLTASPADGVRLPRRHPTEMRLLDPTEVAALANALPDRYSSLAITAAYTGMRWGELAGLQPGDLDLPRRRLAVRRTLVEATGHTPQLGPPKSKASERSIAPPTSSPRPSLGISRPTRLSTTWCGPPNKVRCSAEVLSGAYGGKPWPTPSGHHAGSTICATPSPPG